MLPYGLLGLLCELKLGPGRPLLGELVHLCSQVLRLHQVGGIPDDTTQKCSGTLKAKILGFTLKPRLAQIFHYSCAEKAHYIFISETAPKKENSKATLGLVVVPFD